MKTIKKLITLTLFLLSLQTISQASQLSAEQEADTPMSREALIKDIVDMYPQYVEGFQVLGRGDNGFSNFLDEKLSRDDNEESNAGEVLEAALDEIEDGMQATFIQALQKSNPDFIHNLNLADLHTLADLSPLAPVMNLAHSTDPIVQYAMNHSGFSSMNENRECMLPVIQGWVRKWLINTPDMKDNVGRGGRNLLFKATNSGDLEQMQLLIHAGANVDARDLYGYTPLFDAIHQTVKLIEKAKNAIAAMKILLTAGANVNSKNINGWTPLMRAVYHRKNVEVIKLLLDAHANPNIIANDRDSPLLQAVHGLDYLSVIEMLLAAHADPNVQDKYGKTPLHYVYTIVEAQALLDAGANQNIHDNNGRTPVDVAATPEIRDLLMQYQNGGR